MKRILSIYMWLVGGLGYFLIFIMIVILNPFVKKNFLYTFLKSTTKILLRILFIRTTIVYREEIDKNKTYIFMPNHVSLIDVLVAGAYWPVNMNAIEAHTHFKWFLYGKVIRIFEQIPINRKSPRASLKSFEIAKERLKIRSIILFPEGHRSKDGQMRPFKKLPFKFAKETTAEVVPVALIGIEKVLPENSIWITPAKIKIIFGKIIDNQQKQSLTVEQLSDKVKTDIQQMINKYTNPENQK